MRLPNSGRPFRHRPATPPRSPRLPPVILKFVGPSSAGVESPKCWNRGCARPLDLILEKTHGRVFVIAVAEQSAYVRRDAPLGQRQVMTKLVLRTPHSEAH